MGLVAEEIEIIAGLARAAPEYPRRVLSFGHPDILATPEELAPILGKTLVPDNAPLRDRWRGKMGDSAVGMARPVFEALNLELTCVDAIKGPGVDERANLCFPLGPRHHGKYALVVDPGTSEHVFMAGQALLTAALSVAVGGYIYHTVPLAGWNHGFWNFSPTTFTHVYSASNGFEVQRLEAWYGRKRLPVSPSGAFKIPNEGFRLNLLCVVKKVEARPIIMPFQEKYAPRD